METAIERLSSGLRINSAKDDAAGLAISQRMQNQIRGMKMAGQNIKSGTDLIQTAERWNERNPEYSRSNEGTSSSISIG